ncbi:epl1 protein [Moniliophthora roreri MCA 2997]|uniref:Cerato-platanin 5 n=2 Tax=Moniliophthora roreri TaxID=221103 RepID=S4UQ22_MONRR|nr:cerato-platanin 5 [Moniliophthora roreri]ESK87457.1 epl1 protein [Moniliophthora roreri MCA 2997]KAI3616822.1 epl1 protein [Moniliophthora roreri]KAI3616930.1 epl1 protein [Moniliophthora roreri]
MKLFAPLLSLALAASCSAWILKWDGVYEQYNQTVSSLACSSVLTEKGYKVLGDIPNFYNFGGAPEGKTQCGSCWKLRYKGNSAFVTVVDRVATDDLFVVATDTVKNLTTFNGVPEGYDWGTVTLFSAYEVDGSCCGFSTGKTCGDP